MKILTAAEMGAADRRTAEEFGVSLGDLMEAAGGAVAGFCLRRYWAAERSGGAERSGATLHGCGF